MVEGVNEEAGMEVRTRRWAQDSLEAGINALYVAFGVEGERIREEFRC